MDADPVALVRSGYNAISRTYRGDDDTAREYQPWLARLQESIPQGGPVLDLGCGCGIPVARALAAAGHRVTGVDISDVQVERARRLVPGAVFLRADATDTDFPPDSFDAVVCLYTLIHLPLDRQPLLLGSIARWLRPGGWLLAVTGQYAWTGTQGSWLGGTAPMWWSQADAATYRTWLTQAGLEVTRQQFVPEGDSGHALFWARLPEDEHRDRSPRDRADRAGRLRLDHPPGAPHRAVPGEVTGDGRRHPR